MLKKTLENFAIKQLGFDACGFTSPFLDSELDAYRQLIQAEKYGQLAYLKRHLPLKENPELLLPGVKSAIVVIKNYKYTAQKHLTEPPKMARFAHGEDYHIAIKAKLQQLVEQLQKLVPQAECYAGVDSRPIAERSLAIKAGIGFRGKNTLVIRPGLGSYFVIGVILTTALFEADQPLAQTCGQCDLCLKACPNQALSNNGLEIEKCTSYKTLCRKEPPTPAELEHGQNWIHGCDICQEVCPYNDGTPIISACDAKILQA